ncbi:colicin immunity domain-containing protein [Streptomyces sp. NPDC051172]|uniref:colicin immunity domain-containing protein n=1 Tax=Streptomyces sp. NPDC051172 TaxID=3155796 RepID=UPI003419FDF5
MTEVVVAKTPSVPMFGCSGMERDLAEAGEQSAGSRERRATAGIRRSGQSQARCEPQQGAGPREVFGSVDRQSFVRDAEHPYVVAMFDEAQHLHAFGAFQRPLREMPERVEGRSGEAVETELTQVPPSVTARVGDRLPGENEGVERRNAMDAGERVSDTIATALDTVFHALEDYTIDPGLRDEDDLTDEELRQHVADALRQLGDL